MTIPTKMSLCTIHILLVIFSSVTIATETIQSSNDELDENEMIKVNNMLHEIAEILSLNKTTIQITDQSYIQQNIIQTTNQHNAFRKYFENGCIFVIAVPARKPYAKWIMNKMGISDDMVIYFDAIQGQYLRHLATTMVNLGILDADWGTNHYHIASHVNFFNSLGCSLSHMYVWYHHFHKNPSCNKVLIFEDDVIYAQKSIPELHTHFDRVMNEFRTNQRLLEWDEINFGGFMGKVKRKWYLVNNSHDIYTGFDLSAGRYALSRNAVNKIIKYYAHDILPIRFEIDTKLSMIAQTNNSVNVEAKFNKYGVWPGVFFFNDCLGSTQGNSRDERYKKWCCERKHYMLPPSMHVPCDSHQ